MNSSHASRGFREWPAIARPLTDTRPSVDSPDHPRMAWVRDWPRTIPTFSLSLYLSISLRFNFSSGGKPYFILLCSTLATSGRYLYIEDIIAHSIRSSPSTVCRRPLRSYATCGSPSTLHHAHSHASCMATCTPRSPPRAAMCIQIPLRTYLHFNLSIYATPTM